MNRKKKRRELRKDKYLLESFNKPNNLTDIRHQSYVTYNKLFVLQDFFV